MNPLKHILLAATLAFLLLGCATEYQHEGMTGGYNDKQLGPDSYRVTFSGNGYMPLEKAKDFAMLRAAEVTLAHGFSHFRVVTDKSQTTKSMEGAPAATVALTGGGVMTFPAQMSEVQRPFADLTIRCSKGKSAGSQDAQTLRTELKAKYAVKG